MTSQQVNGAEKGKGKALHAVDLDGHDLPPSPASSSPRNGRRYALATELVYTEGSDQYGASSVPIYQVGNFQHWALYPKVKTDGNGSRQRSNRHLPVLGVANTTTLVLGILHALISNDISLRS